jgi:glutathione S-transferase
MTESIIFYHHPMSRSRIVHWMLEEVGAPYELKLVRFDLGEHKEPGFLAVNPMGKIPAITHRGIVVTETAAICAYLADAFPQARLAPETSDAKRGTYLRWLFFSAGCLEPALVDRVLSRPLVEKRSTLGYGSYEDTLNALEKALSPGPYVLGQQFSAADVHIASTLGWGMAMKGLEPQATLQSYVARCSERPAYKRVAAQNEQLAAQLKPAG